MLGPIDIKEVVDRISSVILKTTLPLYTLNKNRYTIHSNGVLLFDRNKAYILTTEHTFDKMDPGEIFIYLNGSFYCLEGKIKGDRTQDLAIFELDNSTAKDLTKSYAFIDRTQIEFEHLSEPKQKYLFIGYPSSKTKILGMKLFEKPLVYHTSSEQVQPNSDEIAFAYNKRKSVTYEKRVYTFAPDPNGLSGSGLWYIPSFSNKITFKLVGIFKEFDRKKNTGVATHVKSLIGKL